MDPAELAELSVLVVDDEPGIRDSLKAYLQHLGISNVSTAEDGKSALEALQRQRYDYVFTDLMMPEVGGMEILRSIHHNWRPTSVIVMTGYPSMEKVIETMRHGASDFLIKPFRLQDLKVSLERVHRLHKLMAKNLKLNREIEQKKQVEILNLELQKKIKEKSILYDIIDSLSKIQSSDNLYGFLVEKAAQCCGADKACFLIYDHEETGLIALAAYGMNGLRPGFHVPLENNGGMAGLSPRFLEDMFGCRVERPLSVDQVTRTPELMASPLKIRQEPFGVLLVAGRGIGGFEREDEFILGFLAERAAQNVENIALYDSLKENLFATLGALVSAIEARDRYTQQHSERVTRLAVEIAQEMGTSLEDQRRIESSGPLHDIGKIGIEDSILKKPGRLTEEEFQKIKEHPLIGASIVSPLDLDPAEMSVIRNHHERWDGRGYPDALRGEDIPLLARILSVADAFDAMNSDRAYRKALPLDVCMKELRKNSGTQFDPRVIEAALVVLDLGWSPSQQDSPLKARLILPERAKVVVVEGSG